MSGEIAKREFILCRRHRYIAKAASLQNIGQTLGVIKLRMLEAICWPTVAEDPSKERTLVVNDKSCYATSRQFAKKGSKNADRIKEVIKDMDSDNKIQTSIFYERIELSDVLFNCDFFGGQRVSESLPNRAIGFR